MSETKRNLVLDEPLIVDKPEMLFIGPSRRYHFEANGGIPAQWNEFNQFQATVQNQVGGNAYGIIFNNDDAGNFDYMTAIEVFNFNDTPERFHRLRLPAQRYAIFACDQHVSALQGCMQVIFTSWLPGSGHEVADAPTLECYRENFDPATGNGGFQLWLQIK